MALLRNTSADRNRLRANSVSRAHRNLFFMLSLLPPQPTPPWVTRKTPGSEWELQFPGLEEEMLFLPTLILHLQIDLPAAGLLTSPALQETTSALLQALCTLGLVARETPRSPHYCSRATTAGLMPGTAGLPRNFGAASSHLWSLILCQSKQLLNQINSCSLLYTHGFFNTRGNRHLVLQIHTVPPQH